MIGYSKALWRRTKLVWALLKRKTVRSEMVGRYKLGTLKYAEALEMKLAYDKLTREVQQLREYL